MNVRLLLFAACRDAAGLPELVLAVADGSGVPELWAAIEGACPALVPFRATARMAVNREFAGEGTRVRPGDEVALIPPVSGG